MSQLRAEMTQDAQVEGGWHHHVMRLLVGRRDKGSERQKLAEDLLDKAALAKEKIDFGREDHGYTLLSHTCKNGLDEVLETVLSSLQGDDALKRDLLNRGTPSLLWIATVEGHAEILRILGRFRNLIDVDMSTAPDGTTPLTMAVAKLNFEALKILRIFYSTDEVLTALAAPAGSIQRKIYSTAPFDLAVDGEVGGAFPTLSKNASLEALNLERGVQNLSFLMKVSQIFPLFNGDIEPSIPVIAQSRESISIRHDVSPKMLKEFCTMEHNKDVRDIDEIALYPCSGECKQ